MEQDLKVSPTVSVIIPAYNYGRYVESSIESALAQTYPISEIIVVDDGSTDETECVVGGFGEQVRYIRLEHAGVSAARNRGVAESTGELLAFLDADDIWLPEKIAKQVARFSDPEIGLVYCGMQEFDSASGEPLDLQLNGAEGWVAHQHVLFEGEIIDAGGSAIMVSREAFVNVGGFDTRFRNGEDWEFCFRIAQRYKVGYVREALVDYRIHIANVTKDVAEMERSMLIALGKIFETEDEALRRVRRRSYGNIHKVLAGSFLYSRDYSGFARNVLKSLWYRPKFLRFYLRELTRRRNGGVKR